MFFMVFLGFWPGDPHEFGLLSYHSRGHTLGRPPHFGEKEHSQAIHAQAVLATYSWLLAQSTYQGIMSSWLLLNK